MAERRMFAKTMLHSDDFMLLPPMSQLLYFHLGMAADDEGFINCTAMTMRLVGAEKEDLEALTDKGYLLRFESGVTLITHWYRHNQIRRDRFRPTECVKEKAQVYLNQALEYCFGTPESAAEPTVDMMATDGIQPVPEEKSVTETAEEPVDFVNEEVKKITERAEITGEQAVATTATNGIPQAAAKKAVAKPNNKEAPETTAKSTENNISPATAMVDTLATGGEPTVDPVATQVRIGKDRVVEDRLGEERKGKESEAKRESYHHYPEGECEGEPSEPLHNYGPAGRVLLTEKEYAKLKKEVRHFERRINNLDLWLGRYECGGHYEVLCHWNVLAWPRDEFARRLNSA